MLQTYLFCFSKGAEPIQRVQNFWEQCVKIAVPFTFNLIKQINRIRACWLAKYILHVDKFCMVVNHQEEEVKHLSKEWMVCHLRSSLF